jgi:hypothetical protein
MLKDTQCCVYEKERDTQCCVYKKERFQGPFPFTGSKSVIWKAILLKMCFRDEACAALPLPAGGWTVPQSFMPENPHNYEKVQLWLGADLCTIPT